MPESGPRRAALRCRRGGERDRWQANGRRRRRASVQASYALPSWAARPRSLRRSSIKAARAVSGLEQQPLEQLRRAWRAATNMQIDGYDARGPPADRVAAGKNTAVHRTVSDRDHPFGVRRSIIRALKRLAHVPGDRPRHEQHVGMARRSHEVQPEAFEIIEGVVERVDLEFAAIA